MSRPNAAQHGEAVFDLIPINDGWIGGPDLCRLTGLTDHQVRKGVAHLRDHYPEWPLLSSVKGYAFNMDGADVAAFRSWRAKCALTTVRRLYTGAIYPYLARLDNEMVTKAIGRQFERVLEDLADIVG